MSYSTGKRKSFDKHVAIYISIDALLRPDYPYIIYNSNQPPSDMVAQEVFNVHKHHVRTHARTPNCDDYDVW